MLLSVCKSKIHRATITEANLHYEGSLTVDEKLLEAAAILPYEKVSVVNIHNGARLDTYVICGARDSGVICLNGAAARMGEPGDLIIIISYALLDVQEAQAGFKPRIVLVDQANRIVESPDHK